MTPLLTFSSILMMIVMTNGHMTGHAGSMINADQYRSMPDQISGIDPKCISIKINANQSTLIFIDQHWCQCHRFDPALIDIDWHGLLIQHTLI